MRRIAALALAIGAAGVLACVQPRDTRTSIRIAYKHPLVTLDPYGHDDFVTRAVLGAVYEPLVRVDSTLAVMPCLAERWETPDDLSWRLTIRRNVTFQDGSPLRAEDVVQSLRHAMTAPNSRVATYLSGIVSVGLAEEAPDTVVIRTREPKPLLLTRLALVPVVPRRVLENAVAPVGTGPYRWVSGSASGPIQLERWEGYWGPAPAADSVTVDFVPEVKRLVELVEAGALDAVAEISASAVPPRGFGPAWRVVQFPAAVTAILGCNVLMPPLDDVRVREAIDLAIDREALVREAGLHRAEPAVGLVPQSVVGALPAKGPRGSDPERARALLAEAGWSGGVDLTLEHSGLPGSVIEVLGRQLARAGIRVTPVCRPWETFYRRLLDRQCQLAVFGWEFPFGDASDLLDALVHSRDPARHLGLQNGSGYANPEVDRWIEAADREPRTLARRDLIHRALRQVRTDRPLIPLYHRSRIALVRRPFDIQPWGTGQVSPQCVVLLPGASLD